MFHPYTGGMAMMHRLTIRDRNKGNEILLVVDQCAKPDGSIGERIKDYIRLCARCNRDNLELVLTPFITDTGEVLGQVQRRANRRSRYHSTVTTIKGR